ncbi:Glyoxalase/bleomycin resistance protein/dioxygenase [Zymomonas mobilis subsp. mobilis str. CP4 = NRRL B-14023]|nr:Glyoxalase/bleomycin resistance protein/dioxygenase [Zymomonas mobilis subsp. mobilis str. CP4 = NRRL B-14023]
MSFGREIERLKGYLSRLLIISLSIQVISSECYLAVLGMKHSLVSSRQGDAPRNILLFGKQKINLRPIEASQKV